MTESKPKLNGESKVKIFKDLKVDVIDAKKCCACGACVAYCESQSFDVIKMEDYSPKFKSGANEKNCTECGICYYICPQTATLEDLLKETHLIKDEIGQVKNVIAAKTTKKGIEEVGQDGGIVTTLLTYLFDKYEIDAAIVSEFDNNYEPIPKIIFNKEELLKSSGTRYSISSQILPLKDLYNIPANILSDHGIYSIEAMRVAFVGTPCQCRAVSKMKFLNIKPAHVVKFIISLFCFENFNYSQLYDKVKLKTKVEPKNIKKTWIKKNFFIQTKDDKQFEIPIKELDPAVRDHCHACDEFTGMYSDISVGASGAPPGHSMVIMRSEKGQKIINTLLSLGYIAQFIPPIDQSAEWEGKKLNWFKKMVSLKTK